MRNQEIPKPVLNNAIERLKEAGFKHRLNNQALRMISETTEIVNYLGGRIDWNEPQTVTPTHG